MKNFICFCLFLSAVFCFAAETESRVEKSTDSVLASVNGEPISLSDILFETQNEEYYMANALDKERVAQTILELRKKTLEDLIDRKLILLEYKKNPFPIDNQTISSALDEMAVKANCRTRSEFYEKIRSSGLSVDYFRQKVEERITVQYVVGRELYVNVNVSPKTVYEYYKANENKFVVPEKMRLNILFLSSKNPDFEANRKAVAEKISSNSSDFYSLVKEYSELPSARRNDFAVESTAEALRQEFQEVLKEKKTEQIIGPLEISGEGVYYLMVDKIIPGKKYSLDEVRLQIIKKLEEEQREKAYQEYVQKLRSNAIIRYMF